jgi:hypothetical protein
VARKLLNWCADELQGLGGVDCAGQYPSEHLIGHELIVSQNIGLQAKILSTRTFTIFVVMALVTTFITTPLTTWLYPNWYQVKVERWRRGEIDWEGNPVQQDNRNDSVALAKDNLKTAPVRKLLVYLRLDGLSGICTLAALLSTNRSQPTRLHPTKTPKQSDQTVEDPIPNETESDEPPLRVHGVRLIELTDRHSSVMKVAAGEQALWDPVVNTFRAFGDWHDLCLMAGVSVVPEHSYADTVVDMAQQDTADLLLLPWSETGTLADRQNGLEVDATSRFANGVYTNFVADILNRVPGHVGIFLERGLSSSFKRPTLDHTTSGMSIQSSMWARQPTGNRSHHIVLPFFGGVDDRFALRFVLQLARNDHVTATVIQIGELSGESGKMGMTTAVSASSSEASPASISHSDLVFFETLRDSVPEDLKDRVVFSQPALTESITDPIRMAVVAVREELNRTSNKANNTVVVGRRSGSSEVELPISDEGIGNDTRQTLGALGTAMVQPESKIFGSTLILQAGPLTSADYY